MRIAFLNLISILILISCSKSEENLVGIYQSEKVRIFELPSFYLSGFDGFSKGAKLELFFDNSFKYETCGNLSSGTWEQIDDSLFLHVNQSRLRIDSLNLTKENGNSIANPKQQIKFEIKGDLLISYGKTLSGKKILDKLRKNEP